MSVQDQPLFASTSLAERIERVETRLIVAVTEAAGRRTGGRTFVIPAARGAAYFAGPGSPMNKVVGVGFGGMPGDAELTEISTRSPRSTPRYRSSSPASATRRSRPH